MDQEEFMIGELAEKAGVSVRTIRYYVSEGLLPSPEVRGRYTVYDEDYLNRIRLIKRLKDAFLPIKEIRMVLETKSLNEIEEFLSHYEINRPSPNDALSYLAGVMEKTPRPTIHENRLFSQEPGMRTNMDRSSRQPDLLDDPNGFVWRKFVIRPGVEIHIDDQLYSQNRSLIKRMIDEFKLMFRKDDPKNT